MAEAGWRGLLEQAWTAVAGDARVPTEVEVTGPAARDRLPSTFPVADVAVACTASALLAATALHAQPPSRSSRRPASVSLDPVHVAAAVRSEAYLRVNGEPLGPGFAPLSRFWPTAEGWVRTHANYPWHQDALLAALGTDAEGVADALAELPALEAEQRIVDAGGVAAALRTPEQWLAHPHGQVVAGQPLIADTRFDLPGGTARGGAPRWVGHREPGALPASGVRVLDLTRVIAGPVATRYLAALGADVLRLDPPSRPELPLHRYDGLLGKRSAVLDAATAAGVARLHELLDTADVLVHGYRPGALAAFGLDGAELAERHPGLVVVALSAWGRHGPWGGRRGFDSIVQVGTGIAVRESPDAEANAEADAEAVGGASRPGALPCQLLDHGTGYLCAAAALDGLRRRAESGGTWLRELSLARTAHWLLSQPPVDRPSAAGDPGQRGNPGWLVTLPSAEGPVRTVAPPGALGGIALRWPELPVRYGIDEPQWTVRQPWCG